GHVIGDGLIAREVAWTLAGCNRSDLVVGKPAGFCNHDMSIDLTSGAKFRAGHQDRDLANLFRERRREGEGLDQLPDRLSELGLVQPRIPWAHQRAVLGDGGKSLEVLLDAGAHILI